MIVYVLFVHKKSVSKRKVCIIFIRNIKLKKKTKKPKKTFLVGFFRWFFVFYGWVFYCQPCIEDSSNLLTATRSCFRYTGLDYAFQISMLQARILSCIFRFFSLADLAGFSIFVNADSWSKARPCCYTEYLIFNFHFFFLFVQISIFSVVKREEIFT